MISILLASYNGEKYISGQIDSLLKQTEQGFKLFICDDKSTDSTYSIIKDYAGKYPDKIIASQNDINTGEAKINFIKMMINHKDDYIMLCDQDDVWMPDKIEKSLKKIKEMEEQHGCSKPVLVHTDLSVVDEELNIISPSYIKAVNVRYKNKALKKVVIQNFVAGCTVIYNRAFGELISAQPEYMIMHDWWIVLIAGAFGEVGTLCEPTILYRQHAKNVHGTNRRTPSSHFFHKVFNSGEIKATLASTYKQAGCFLALYGERLSEDDFKLIRDYASMPGKSKCGRVRVLFKYGTWKNGLLRRLAQVLFV